MSQPPGPTLPTPGAGFGPADSFGAPGTGPVLFDGPAPVLVSFAPPAKQNRLTIAVRGLLAIPHLIILYALGIAAEVVAFIGWWAALFTGSLPEWAHTFITGVVRWQARVYAYSFFLTDAYPPFSLDDQAYPVRLVTARARLNRAAVFFRLILVIPAGIVIGIALYGMAVLSFFCWLIALVAGRLPEPLHQAIAAVLRYSFRYSGYFFLVTGVYPWWGLFGDPVAVPAAAAEPATDADSTPAAAPDPWKLQLSGAAKGLVSLFFALGAAAIAVVAIVVPSASSNPVVAFSNVRGLVIIGQAYSQATSSTQAFSQAVQACGQLSCVTAQVQKEATALQTFASSVRSAGLVGQPGADASKLASDAASAAQALDQLATATSVAQYQSDVVSSGVQQKLTSIDSDYRKLVKDMGPS
jgi:hypothetical protein